MSRRPFAPTDEQKRLVVEMATASKSQDEIADTLGIAATTLRLHFRAELDAGTRQSGRPCFAPTEQQREDVRVLVGRVNQRAIASRLKISVPTLERHFRDDLDRGYEACEADMWIFLYRGAKEGSVSAIKEFQRRTMALNFSKTNSVAAPPQSENEKRIDKEIAAGAQGKKELAQLTAERQATGKFEVPPAPGKMH